MSDNSQKYKSWKVIFSQDNKVYITSFFSVSDDYNRVVLDTIPDIPDSDYVNASYVDVSMECLFHLQI